MEHSFTKMNVAILLTVHNRKAKTLSCLNSIYSQKSLENVNIEIFMVDDGSTDGTCDEVKLKHPKVIILKGDGTLFWNGGMRMAWEYASSKFDYDYYLWLNDDTKIYENTIFKLLEYSNKYQNNSIMVGSTLSSQKKNTITYGGRDKNGNILIPRDFEIECNYFNGNIVLIPRLVFKKVGYNDNIFKHALGDYDYGRRANKIKIKSFVVPGYLGECDEHEDLAIWCNPKYNLKTRLKYFKTPIGMNPNEYFVYDLRHNGVLSSIFHYITIHIRLLFPIIWSK